MSSTDDWLQNGLPVYSGGKDRSTARRLIERLGGPQGIKTAYTTNGDGSVTSVKLRGDCAPEVTTTVVEKPQIKPYVEIDTALRTYHVDHKNYHVSSNKDKALRPFLMKYIKKVVFHGLTVEFTLPDSADSDTYYSERTITPKTPGFSDYPFFSKGFWSAGFFSAGFWGVASQPYVDLTHAERVYVRTLLHKAYVEASVAQIVIHAEKFNVSVLEAIEQLRVKLKLKHDRVLTIFDEVTHLSKLAEVRNEKQDNAAYVLLENEPFSVRTLSNEEMALFSKEQSLSAKTVFCEESVVSNRQTTTQVFTHDESMNLHH